MSYFLPYAHEIGCGILAICFLRQREQLTVLCHQIPKLMDEIGRTLVVKSHTILYLMLVQNRVPTLTIPMVPACEEFEDKTHLFINVFTCLLRSDVRNVFSEAFGANSDFLHEVNILLLYFVRHSQPNHGDEWKHPIFAVLAGLEDLLQLVEKGTKDGALMSSKEVLQLAAENVR
jgi:hypothetical protein